MASKGKKDTPVSTFSFKLHSTLSFFTIFRETRSFLLSVGLCAECSRDHFQKVFFVEDVVTYHSSKSTGENNTINERLNSIQLLQRQGPGKCCSCWLSGTLSWLSGTFEWNEAIMNAILWQVKMSSVGEIFSKYPRAVSSLSRQMMFVSKVLK